MTKNYKFENNSAIYSIGEIRLKMKETRDHHPSLDESISLFKICYDYIPKVDGYNWDKKNDIEIKR